MLKKKMIFIAFKLSDVVFITRINVKMTTIIGILTFMSMALQISCIVALSLKKVLLTSRPYFVFAATGSSYGSNVKIE